MGYAYNEHSISDRTKSKTVDCQRYSFNLNGIKFYFIDTPGVNDTGGNLQDSQNVEKVFSHIENIPELTALILVLNGAVARITINIKNVLAVYRDRLPDAIYSNTIIVLTNCEAHTVNFSPRDVGLPEQCPVFYMQNSAFSSNPTTWSSNAITSLQRHFDLSMKTMDHIFTQLLSLKPTSTKLFKDMNDDRNRIKQQLHQARMTILDLQNLEDELVAFELSADINAANAEKFQDFMRERKIVQNRRIDTQYYNTICSRCESVCHQNCTLNEVPTRGSDTLFRCSAMNSNGWCMKCPNRCGAPVHFHGRYIMEKVKVPVVEVVESMQQRFLQAKQEQKAADLKCNDLQTSKKVLESELQQQYKEVKESISSLQETCKDSNITTILFQFIELLEKDASSLKSYSVVKKSREFITKLKQLCLVSEQLNDTQQAIRSQSSDKQPSKKPSARGKSRNDENLLPNNTSKTEDLLYCRSADQFGSSKALCLYQQSQHHLRSIVKDGHHDDNDVFHDALENEQKKSNQELLITDESKGSKHEEKLQLRQDMTDQRYNFKLEGRREDLAMLPLKKLLHLLNNGVDDSSISDIKNELQRRCSGQSIGFLMHNEQLVLCEQYAKHQQMEFRDLLRLSLQLIDEMNELTGGDPFKIDLIPVEKRLQLSAINLLIKKKD
jgi:hypothetical protein